MEPIKRKTKGVLAEMIKNTNPESLEKTRKEMMGKLDNKWHYTKDKDYPTMEEQGVNEDPSIQCLVVRKGFGACVLSWNPYYTCWDDEDGDDYECDKDDVVRWRYIDSLLAEK